MNAEQASTVEQVFGTRNKTGLVLGPLVFTVMVMMTPPEGMGVEAWRVAAIGLWMAVWWISEATSVYATALLPIALFPFFGVFGIRQAVAPYANPLIFLFMGGFLIAQSMQRWNLHKRIALRLLSITGTKSHRLIGGFMLTCALLSMWVSNTATAVMMMPIGLSVASLLVGRDSEAKEMAPFRTALFLGIAYGCSLGGIATLIGTPPNALLAAYLADNHDIHIGFAQWMAAGLPLSMALLALTWALLTKILFRVPNSPIAGAEEVIGQELRAMGPMSKGEKLAGSVFVLTALLWVTRPLISGYFPTMNLSDSGIAIAMAVLLFVLPVDMSKRQFALNWEQAIRIPWGVLLLFGGGLSLASAIGATGLAEWLGGALSGFASWPVWIVMLLSVTLIVFLTEMTSNTATTAAVLPLLAAISLQMGETAAYLAVPAAIAASCAFMMPVATPPNAIVYASGCVTIPQMARTGIVLNIVCIVVVTLIAELFILRVLGV
jgi:solute carrier family 13 (sodium-dependent dicarboxylate transporter), member 2/3/5